jgi:hypothetical protein
MVAATSLVLALSGCYTLMQHPGVARMNYRRPDSTQPCRSCHSQEEIDGALRHAHRDHEPGAWGQLSHPWWLSARDSTRSDGAPAD